MPFTNDFKWNNSDVPRLLIDENNTWISVKCLSRGNGLAGTLFKNVKYSACLYPINQQFLWKAFHLKGMKLFPISQSNVPFDLYWCSQFAKHSLIASIASKWVWEAVAAHTLQKHFADCKTERHVTPNQVRKLQTPLRPPVRGKTFLQQSSSQVTVTIYRCILYFK